MSNYNFGLSATVAEPGSFYDLGSTQDRLVEVLVDCPGVQGLYTYRIPPDMQVEPGDILNVPFGSQQVGAIAIREINQLPADLNLSQIRDVEEVVCSGFFPTNYWTLLERVAEYYYTQLIQVVKVALPPGLLARSQRRIRLKPDNIENPSPSPSPLAGRGAREIENPNPQKGSRASGVEAFLSHAASSILQLLQAGKTGDYTWKYLQQQLSKKHRITPTPARRGLQELIRRGLVESYLEEQRPPQPQLKQAVSLTGYRHSPDLTSRQRELLKFLGQHDGDLWVDDFVEIYNTTRETIQRLEEKGCVVIEEREILRLESSPVVESDRSKSLTESQTQALATITNLSNFAQVLLHGVTGSGKTEVYLQAIAPLLEQGKSALVLVPEIGLTPQLTDRFRARFGNKVCVYHSALSDGERYDTWRQMLTGEPQVLIGTRSAVFAPLPKLGLIILDEEHDSSFKQDQPVPTYHARNVATWRAELENCPLVLGSATPSLDTWVTINQGSRENNFSNPSPLSPPPSPSHYLSLPERIQSRPLPPVEVVDMRQELREGNRSIFSRSLKEALQQLQEREQQGILFIHRRGHSTFVSCRTCGYVIECPNCDVSLAYHHTQERAPELLRCHYCNFVSAHPSNCPECSSPYLKFFGSGTQRVVQELEKEFPQLRPLRFDSDTTRTKGAHRTLLTRFVNREFDLLVGTQMLTKGLDIPQVTLVGIVAADGLLHFPDYRASERAFQTLIQVAGRSGRGDDPGRVILQTYTPEHPVIQAARTHDYQSFTEAELQQRATLNYPPYGRLILFKLSSLEETAVQETAELLANELEKNEPNDSTSSYEILGPAPANIMRVANRYRWQILLKLPLDSTVTLPDFNYLRELCPSSVSLTIDVDPLNMM
ncbi:replication restart DNA helicase PriA [Crinalium epipsammum PCC 9333]|uniref:Replication restart protein PriA n=1 Tax=Crinalium epipsammum PCC 9333 TaxID=1173022 RepID=K9W051_9CYAN|nr:primosomal protein N' [Crinalium epipsammum]AFZ13117.1 replication restart DNA helicase PriA [Crinalium epipsammum PCC 9333]